MTDNAARYLGFAFASAEMLVEADPSGRIVLALGATQKLVGIPQDKLGGLRLDSLFTADGADLIRALIDGLDAADRRGPVRVQLCDEAGEPAGRFVGFSACRLPQLAPNISCALTASAAVGQAVPARGPHGLHGKADFLAASAGLLEAAPGIDLEVAFLEFEGLAAATAAMDSLAADRARSRVAAAVRSESFGGNSAGQISDDRFALVRNGGESPELLLRRLTAAASKAGVPVEVSGANADLQSRATPSGDEQGMRALKFALDAFIKGGPQTAGAAFGAILARTNADAKAFSKQVARKEFRLAYQPIVSLKTGELHHFEVLSRLADDDASPASMIQMAEELELIHDLDMAVAEQVIRKMTQAAGRRLNLAVNLSARSLMRPAFLQALLDKARAGGPTLVGRLIFEVTESAALDDLEAANNNIQALRQAGYPVCLDDFGSGAATLSYLRALAVDTVKIDGQYVKDIAAGGRADSVVRHIAGLCRDLKVESVAEMIETREAAQILLTMGVDFGQGYHFGRPSPEPIFNPNATKVARRSGVRDTWG